MTQSNFMPFVNSVAEAVELSVDGKKKKFWKKEILPSGSIDYKGTKLDFSVINPACVQAFEDGAFPQVPYVLSLDDNSHPKEGEEWKTLKGDLEKVELSQDGRLFGYLSLDEEAEKLVKASNGKFGVSGKIEVDYERKDSGKRYPYALSHVCGTTRPFIKGMEPWQAVELSDEDKSETTIDLSTEVIERELNKLEKKSTSTSNKNSEEVEVPGIDKETLDFLVQFAKDSKAAEEKINGLNKKDSDATAPAELSEAVKAQITLSETNAKQAFELAERAQAELAETRWEKRKGELIRDGVPPALLTDKVEKFMKHPRKVTVELSDSDSLDAHEVIGGLLDACKGTIKFSEEGHSLTDIGGEADVSKEFQEFMEDWNYVPRSK